MSTSGAMLSAFRRSLEHVYFGDRCRQYTAATNWEAGPTFACHVEESTAGVGAAIDFEGGNGYGYTVWMPADQAMDSTDRIKWLTATDPGVGMLEVMRVAPAGTLDGARKAETVMR